MHFADSKEFSNFIVENAMSKYTYLVVFAASIGDLRLSSFCNISIMNM